MSAKDHPPLDSVRIASRGSKLALWQAEYVKALLAKHQIAADIMVVKTTGDRVQDRFLHEMGGKGLFVREIEEALLRGEADLAIHSLKDLPAVTPAAFDLAAVLKRHASGDIMIFHPELSGRLGLKDGLGIGAKELKRWGALSIGTGSLRRKSLLEEASDALTVTPIRGNVDTRLNKLREKQWDAIVLAHASLERLSVADDLVKGVLEPQWFVPSSSQGALVIETRKGHTLSAWLGENLACPVTTLCVSLERSVLAGLGGDCTLPIGVHAQIFDENKQRVLTCQAVILDGKGTTVRTEIRETLSQETSVKDLSRKMVETLVKHGANKVLKSLGIAPVSVEAL